MGVPFKVFREDILQVGKVRVKMVMMGTEESFGEWYQIVRGPHQRLPDLIAPNFLEARPRPRHHSF
jgi:hypothetical protein